VGKSGGGKTTLLRTLAGLDRPQHGRVSVPIRRSLVFQEPRLLPWKRVWRNVALGLPRRSGRDQAVKALTEVGLEGHLDAWPLTLSGGEAQRVALARALVREPQLLLLDEPFGALDAVTRRRMNLELQQIWLGRSLTTLMVTHSVDEALFLADRVIVMSGRPGVIVEAVAVPFPRPRRVDVMRTEQFHQLTDHLTLLLEH
jgi:sulfonate transport system ATP-binding protein